MVWLCHQAVSKFVSFLLVSEYSFLLVSDPGMTVLSHPGSCGVPAAESLLWGWKWGPEKAKPFQMACDSWTSHLELPVAFNAVSWCKLFFRLERGGKKKNNKNSSLTLFSYPLLFLFQEKKTFKVYVTIRSWLLLDRKLKRICLSI